MLPLVKMFQLSDLYSKSKDLLDNEQLTVKYRNLIEKYFACNQKLTYLIVLSPYLTRGLCIQCLHYNTTGKTIL